MQDDQKTKADLLQELSKLRKRVSGLKQAAEQWSKTFDATSDLVFVQDKDFKFVKVNKSFCVTGQLRVGHSVSRAEVWHLKKTLLECPNGASLSA